MTFINELKQGQKLSDEIYFVKKKVSAVSKNNRAYISFTLMDKTGTVDAKVWDPDQPEFENVDEDDFIKISGEVILYRNQHQIKLSSCSVAKAGTYTVSDYMPASDKDIEGMYSELLRLVDSVKTDYMKALLDSFFRDNEFAETFKSRSAAKSIHHAFVGGLLEHTLSVAQICNFLARHYGNLDRDLLLTAAICHDIGKTKELSDFPSNDYTDDGQLLGHIVIGAEMVKEHIREIPHFPKVKENELLHCILSHHGKLEFGSPKKPMLLEALALSQADDLDAKQETMKEAIASTVPGETETFSYNKVLDNFFRRTSEEE